MTVAAIYARFSSSSQSDDSIDIQVEKCTAWIEQQGWTRGEIYADFAMSGTTDKRPGFQRCIEDGEAGLYDALVFYKIDRFARNVEVSEKSRKRLKAAGVQVCSVREGMIEDTAESELMAGMNSVFAQYYSSNLSNLIRNGNAKRAEQRKACGHRLFGYDVDDDDRFVVNRSQAEVVRHLFGAYASGQSVNQLANWMEEQGIRTKFGNPWSKGSICRLLKNDAYCGVYRFNGVVDPIEGMPQIIDWELFHEVADRMAGGTRRRRVRDKHEYFLTGRLFCLKCGNPMGGHSGTSANGGKYTYYKCRKPHGCGLTVPCREVEGVVLDAVGELVSDKGLLDEMVSYVVDYARSQPSRVDELEGEVARLEGRYANFVKAIGEGAPYAEFKGYLDETAVEIDRAKMALAREKTERKSVDAAGLPNLLKEAMGKPEFAKRYPMELVATFFDHVYVDDEVVVATLHGGDLREPTPEEVQAIRGEVVAQMEKGEAAGEGGVRLRYLWWSQGDFRRTLAACDGAVFLVSRRRKS